MGEAIVASDVDMTSLDGKNSAADHIIRAAQVVLRVLGGDLTTQKEIGTCLYLLDRLLGPRCPLVWDLRYLIITINKNFSSFLGKIVTSHWCTALVFDVS